MIKSPDVLSSDITVFSYNISSWAAPSSIEKEIYYDHVIPGSELDVAEEMEVVTESSENTCEEGNSSIQLPLTPQLLIFFQQLQPQVPLPNALQHQIPQTVTDCILDEVVTANEDSQSDNGDPSYSDFNSISTLSVCDEDTNDLEKAMSLVDDSDIKQMLSSAETGGDRNFDFVFNFCDEVLSVGNECSSVNNACLTNPHFFGYKNDDARSLSSSSSGVSSQSSQVRPGQNGSSVEDSHSTRNEACRKSARIADKRKRNLTTRRSDETSDLEGSENGDDGVFSSFIPNQKYSKSRFGANKRNRSSVLSKNPDEEFVVGRKLLTSKKRRKSNSKQVGKEPVNNSFEVLKELKQEKNRMAARRCRMKQKLLIDKLAGEAADLQKEGDDLKTEVGNLRSELMTLQSFLKHHDTLITSPTTTGLHCPIGLAVHPSSCETSFHDKKPNRS